MKAMKHITVLLLLVLAGQQAALVHAEDVAKPKITALHQNDKAPYDGVELSPEAVAATIANAEAQKQTASINTDKAVADANAQCALDKQNIQAQAAATNKISTAQITTLQQQNNQLTASLKAAINDQANPMLWGGLGVVAGAAATILVMFAVKKL